MGWDWDLERATTDFSGPRNLGLGEFTRDAIVAGVSRLFSFSSAICLTEVGLGTTKIETRFWNPQY